MATNLKDLVLKELSLVDFPANKEAVVSIYKRDDSAPLLKQGDANMADQDTEMDVLKGQLADLTSKLADSEVIAKMCDDEKDYMKAMDEDKKKEFMAMKPEDRMAAMKVKKSADETLEIDGTVIRKSAVGDGMFAVMKAQQKRLDDQAADIAKARDAAELATFTKRAADDFGHLVGTDAEKAAVLKHMATADEAVQKTFGAIMKSAEDMIKKGFDTKGVGNGRTVIEGSAAEQLDTLAKAHAKDNNVEYAAAYVAVIEKRADLYEQVLKEGN